MTNSAHDIESDTARTRQFRDLQSRWRQTVLGLPAGLDRSGRAVGSLLPADAPPGAQWLTRPIADYVESRLPGAREEKGAIEEDRLLRNLLSSQPLCFNLFGQLDAFKPTAARVLSRVLALPIYRVDAVLVEHAPPAAKERLADRSAFDAYLRASGPAGPLFLAVETKYTEPFSRREYASEKYEALTDDAGGWFLPASSPELRQAATNQLWRTLMLAQATEQFVPGAGDGVVVVMSVAGDAHAEAAVDGVRPCLRESDRRLRHVTYESFVQAAVVEPDLHQWGALFRARYLDVAPFSSP